MRTQTCTLSAQWQKKINISAYKAGNLAYKAEVGEKLDRNWEAKIDQHKL